MVLRSHLSPSLKKKKVLSFPRITPVLTAGRVLRAHPDRYSVLSTLVVLRAHPDRYSVLITLVVLRAHPDRYSALTQISYSVLNFTKTLTKYSVLTLMRYSVLTHQGTPCSPIKVLRAHPSRDSVLTNTGALYLPL